MLKATFTDAVPDIERFAAWWTWIPLYDQEEIFTRTFHVQCHLFPYLGYASWEDYKRGEFLVNMKREQTSAKNDCEGGITSDNLVNVLTLLPLMKDRAICDELRVRIVMPSPAHHARANSRRPAWRW
ncbi:MAG: hypothetical protein IPI00_12505 [Flavobacteriales bacterium]|nr:hypothetical protein [Flavobacteriales bacterium]